jgi:hypothetical protein
MNPTELSLFLLLIGALVFAAIIYGGNDDNDPRFP